MDRLLMARCELLTHNRIAVQNAFPMSSALMKLCGAVLYTMRASAAEEEQIRRCMKLIKQRLGLFSPFRGTVAPLLACMMDMSGDPQRTLEHVQIVHTMLKECFPSSSYLPAVAATIAQQTDPNLFSRQVVRARRIYDRMKAEHPFLTSSDDVIMCTTLAMSGMDDDEMIRRMETAYHLLKEDFRFGNSVQTLSHVLTLLTGDMEPACRRVSLLYKELRDAGAKWGTGTELSILGVLAADGRSIENIVTDILVCEAWLKEQKGFGAMTMTRSARLMYAGLMTQFADDTMEAAVVGNTIAMVIAQQVAMSTVVVVNSTH